MIALALDACTYRGTVAVVRGDAVIASGEAAMRGATDERLMPAVVDVMSRAGVDVRELSAVICGAGPGSFTSLRIAAGIAKGIATARGLPLFAVPSLGLAVGVTPMEPGLYCAAMDALRGDAYVALYDLAANGIVSARQAEWLVSAAHVEQFAAANGAQVLRLAAADDPSSPWPHASSAVRMRDWLDRTAVVDVGSWQPAYGRLAEAQVKWEAAHGRPLAGT